MSANIKEVEAGILANIDNLKALEKWLKQIRSLVEDSPFNGPMQAQSPHLNRVIDALQAAFEPKIDAGLGLVESCMGLYEKAATDVGDVMTAFYAANPQLKPESK